MAPTQQKRNGGWARILAASAAFVAILGVLGWVVSGFFSHNGQLLTGLGPRSKGGRGPALFYQSIGNAPLTDLKARRENRRSPLGSTFTLEIQQCDTVEEAEKQLKSLGQKGIQAYYTPMQKDGRVVYRIRSGIFRSRDLAIQAQRKLRGEVKLTTTVTNLQ